MFRLWARTFRDNHMLKDTCICDVLQTPEHTKYFGHWKKYAMSLIWANLSGWTKPSVISNVMEKHASPRTIS